MSSTKITKDQLPLPKESKRAILKREEPPVRWPSAATGSGAAYGVSNVPAAEEGGMPESCGET